MLSKTALLAVLAVVAVAGCSNSNSTPATGKTMSITSTDSACDLSKSDLIAGRQTFQVENKGSQTTEVYVYAAGDRIMGEVENIGPQVKRDLNVDLQAGKYDVACKPGMTGSGIRKTITVTGSSATTQPETPVARAVSGYREYVENETQELANATETFVDAVKAKNAAAAKTAYPAARLHYERIEPIAESFGDLDPLIDMRIDAANEKTPFVGFHKLEQDLWQKNDISNDTTIASDLETNVEKLAQLVKTVEITPLTMTSGAKSLIDEVAKTKVTGEEERYSHIDLVDFAGNVDGSEAVLTQLLPVLTAKKPDLAAALTDRFKALQDELDKHNLDKHNPDKHKSSDNYVPYTALTPAEIKALATRVDALSEPLGQLGAAVGS